MHEYLFKSNDSIVLFRSRFVDLTVDIQFENTLLYRLSETHPKVPSPSLPKNSNSRMLVHPWNRLLPLLSLSRDTMTIFYPLSSPKWSNMRMMAPTVRDRDKCEALSPWYSAWTKLQYKVWFVSVKAKPNVARILDHCNSSRAKELGWESHVSRNRCVMAK